MANKIFCCMSCADRTVGCHAHCKKYQQDKADYEETKSCMKLKQVATHYTIEAHLRLKNNSDKNRGFRLD